MGSSSAITRTFAGSSHGLWFKNERAGNSRFGFASLAIRAGRVGPVSKPGQQGCVHNLYRGFYYSFCPIRGFEPRILPRYYRWPIRLILRARPNTGRASDLRPSPAYYSGSLRSLGQDGYPFVGPLVIRKYIGIVVRHSAPQTKFIVIVYWWCLACALILLWLPFEWERYSLPLIPPTMLILAKTVDELLCYCWHRLRYQSHQGSRNDQAAIT